MRRSLNSSPQSHRNSIATHRTVSLPDTRLYPVGVSLNC